MTADIYTTLVEIGDKEISLWLYFFFGIWIAFPVGLGIWAIKTKSYWLGFVAVLGLFVPAITMGIHNYVGFVRDMNWTTDDPFFERLIGSELGSGYHWKVRACVWAGEISSLVWPYVAFCNPWARKLFARWGKKCICGYSLAGLTTNTCPECGRTITEPCSNSPQSD